eukprot:4109643-Pyramimonas_sp.AAC.1
MTHTGKAGSIMSNYNYRDRFEGVCLLLHPDTSLVYYRVSCARCRCGLLLAEGSGGVRERLEGSGVVGKAAEPELEAVQHDGAHEVVAPLLGRLEVAHPLKGQ